MQLDHEEVPGRVRESHRWMVDSPGDEGEVSNLQHTDGMEKGLAVPDHRTAESIL